MPCNTNATVMMDAYSHGTMSYSDIFFFNLKTIFEGFSFNLGVWVSATYLSHRALMRLVFVYGHLVLLIECITFIKGAIKLKALRLGTYESHLKPTKI